MRSFGLSLVILACIVAVYFVDISDKMGAKEKKDWGISSTIIIGISFYLIWRDIKRGER